MLETVFDCCVISNFALARAISTLEAVFKNKAIITDFVSAEVLRGIQAGHSRLERIPKTVGAGWLRETGLRTSEERRLCGALSRSLGLGEASSIAVAKSRGFVLASDDRAARAEATALGVPLTGTLGILVTATRTGLCSLRTADAYLGRMVEAGFFSPVGSVREVVSGGKTR